VSGREERAARRAWIAAHHPDRGGDPSTFAAGLAAFDGRFADVVDRRLTVVRSRGPVRSAHRAWRRLVTARRRRTHHGSIS
jgi:hypothetical protein